MSVGPWQIVMIALVVLVLFGASRLGDIGKGLGEGIRNFKKGISGEDEDEESSKEPKEPKPQPVPEPAAPRESSASASAGGALDPHFFAGLNLTLKKMLAEERKTRISGLNIV